MTSEPNGEARHAEATTSHQSDEATEQTPLIPRSAHDEDDVERSSQHNPQSPASTSLLGLIRGSGSKKSRWKRWPSLLALVILCLVIVVILVVAFVVPQNVSEYARKAAVFEPENLSIENFTRDGVVVHVQGTFRMDASRVKKKSVRDWGKFGTWIAREVETEQTNVQVTLPEYGNPVLGSALIPSIKVNVRNGHSTKINILAQVEPGSKETIRRLAEDYMAGRIGQLSIRGRADVVAKTGLITIPKQKITHSLVFDSDAVPDMPDFDIVKLNVNEKDLENGSKGLLAEAAIQVANQYPIDVKVPPLGFDILVPGCAPTDTNIVLADATTAPIHVSPKLPIGVNATGLIRKFPKEAITACPGSSLSPLDFFLGNYIHGNMSTILVRGSKAPSHDTPKWIVDLMSGFTVPVPVPGRSFGHLIKEYKMRHVHFDLPGFFAEPDTPESKPRISAQTRVLIKLPKEINFEVGVDRMRANADVYYKKDKMGELDLHQWLKAKSRLVKTEKDHSDLEVVVDVVKAPLTITDSDVFSEVVSELLISETGVNLTVKAEVDVKMLTPLGELTVRKIPAEGDVPVNPIGSHDFSGFSPKVGNLAITETSKHSLTLGAAMNFTNPTNYSATIPYVDVHISVNDTLIGHATVRSASVTEGENQNLGVTAYWEPLKYGGEKGRAVAAELLSQYISGYNTSLTFHIHNESIPAQPSFGKALSNFSITVPMPSLAAPHAPSDPSDPGKTPEEKPHFLRSTTFHLLSSTAVFTLASPFEHTTMYITRMNATAYYKEHPAGTILYDEPIKVPPGISTTQRIPVEWNFGSLGFEAIKKAVGGELKLDAMADCGVRIGEFEESMWYAGHGIGAGVRL